MSAAEVGHLRSALELLDDAVERGQPLGDQVGVVSRPEEPLAALEHVVHMLVPADAGAASRGLGDPGRVQHRADCDLEQTGQVGRTVGVGQCHGLLRRQRIAAARRVVIDVSARGLSVAPLADVALSEAGPVGELGRCQRACPR